MHKSLRIFLCCSLLCFTACANKNVTPQPTAADTTEKIIGADISFLPQLEAEGIKFSAGSVQKDAIQILKEYHFNYIRLRIFNNPQADSGYSKDGYCSLEETKKMALRIKAAGMKFLLDFHYSDTWADPGKQYKPAAWKNLSFAELTKALHDYTKDVLTQLQAQNTLPDMVQIGNEINHGMLWDDGSFAHPDSLAALLKAGVQATREVSPAIKIMLHIACGGQNDESRIFLDNMMSRGVVFDIIGQSYYPQWHGTLDELKFNLNDLSSRYMQDVIVAEYTQHKIEVNDIAFNLSKGSIKGAFIWEPLNTWEYFFDKQGKAIDSLINIYPAVAEKYGVK